MWYVTVVAAFLSFIMFIHIDSAIADQYKLNTFFIVTGIVFALVAAYALYRVATDGSTPKD